jgi:hypothetical protein
MGSRFNSFTHTHHVPVLTVLPAAAVAAVSSKQALSGQVRELQSSKDSMAALLGQTAQQLQELGAEHSKLQDQLRELTQVGAGSRNDSA